MPPPVAGELEELEELDELEDDAAMLSVITSDSAPMASPILKWLVPAAVLDAAMNWMPLSRDLVVRPAGMGSIQLTQKSGCPVTVRVTGLSPAV